MIVTILEPTDRHDVDRHSPELLQLFLHIHQVEQRAARFELDVEVDVALGRVVAPGDEPNSAAA